MTLPKGGFVGVSPEAATDRPPRVSCKSPAAGTGGQHQQVGGGAP
jgi:hypothetical protein